MSLPLSVLSPAGSRARLLILTYHRVLEVPDPLLPDEAHAASFAQQMDWLANYCRVLPLPEAIDRLANGRLPARAACITFDDGYGNNHDVAAPILRRHGLSATVFVATDAIERGIMWNDLVIEAVRRSGLDTARGWLRTLRASDLKVESIVEVTTGLLDAIKYMSTEERLERATWMFRNAATSSAPRLMMTDDMVRSLASDGFDIGAHTVRHPILARVLQDEAQHEIASSRDWIASVTGQAPVSFAYPNGRPGLDYNESHAAMVREAGFELAVNTRVGCAQGGSDRFHLPRVSLWDRTPFRFIARLTRLYASSYGA